MSKIINWVRKLCGIIECKDCKYYYTNFIDVSGNRIKNRGMCDYVENINSVNHNHFCGYAEKLSR